MERMAMVRQHFTSSFSGFFMVTFILIKPQLTGYTIINMKANNLLEQHLTYLDVSILNMIASSIPFDVHIHIKKG